MKNYLTKPQELEINRQLTRLCNHLNIVPIKDNKFAYHQVLEAGFHYWAEIFKDKNLEVML